MAVILGREILAVLFAMTSCTLAVEILGDTRVSIALEVCKVNPVFFCDTIEVGKIEPPRRTTANTIPAPINVNRPKCTLPTHS